MAAPICLVVRLNPRPAKFDGITVYDVNGKPFDGTTVGANGQLCFNADMDPTTSKITGFQVGLESCSNNCAVVGSPTAKPFVLSFSPRPGNPAFLVLTGTANGQTYSAARNQEGIAGGKPIIRNTFDHLVFVVAVALGVAALGYAIWRFFNRPDPPPDGLGRTNRPAGPG